jgi:hypothetical protein
LTGVDGVDGITKRRWSSKRYGSNLTYEERRDAAVKVMAEVLWSGLTARRI